MLDRWNLDVIYTGFDDPELLEDITRTDSLIDELNRLAEDAGDLTHETVISRYLDVSEQIAESSRRITDYAFLKYSADTGCTEAQSMIGLLQEKLSRTAAADASLCRRIAGFGDLEAIINSNPKLAEFSYLLRKIRENSKYLLSDSEEALFAKMDISGASAWSDLQSSLTSMVKACYRGKELPLSSVRNLAYDPDPSVRKDAYYAELACYRQIETPVAFSLNSIKLQVMNECRMRGYSSPLEKTLKDSRMDRETLDSLWSAVDDALPSFQRYLKTKAKALGHEGALPWWDLFAPIGNSGRKYTVEEAGEYLINIFGKTDPEICRTISSAFNEQWIDFYPREGKVGGAFDSSVPSLQQSRILTNFDGSFSDVVTLAHELGHAFHDQQIFCHKLLNQEYPMPVAETASTFNEVLIVSRAIDESADGMEKLALIESQLSDATQIIIDCYSRFLFESAVFEKRAEEFLDAESLCKLMHEAQLRTYGDGIDENSLNPYMWLCKSHYYSGDLSFYNFPYTFGGLFARGLYAIYQQEGGELFFRRYKEMLCATSVNDVENCAAMIGIDLHDKAFWEAGLRSLTEEIDRFCNLIEALH